MQNTPVNTHSNTHSHTPVRPVSIPGSGIQAGQKAADSGWCVSDCGAAGRAASKTLTQSAGNKLTVVHCSNQIIPSPKRNKKSPVEGFG